jgi:hypothetical protein
LLRPTRNARGGLKEAEMDIQHVNAKLMLGNPGQVDLEPVIRVFQGWIQERACEELLLDVADYRHVPAGPGVVLIGHEANFSVDNADGRLGVRYSRKAVLNGTVQDRLEQALRGALVACQRLENAPELDGSLRFGGQETELFVNDRLLAPNTEDTFHALEPSIRKLSQRLFKGAEYSLQQNLQDPRKLFSVLIRTDRSFETSNLLQNLHG